MFWSLGVSWIEFPTSWKTNLISKRAKAAFTCRQLAMLCVPVPHEISVGTQLYFPYICWRLPHMFSLLYWRSFTHLPVHSPWVSLHFPFMSSCANPRVPSSAPSGLFSFLAPRFSQLYLVSLCISLIISHVFRCKFYNYFLRVLLCFPCSPKPSPCIPNAQGTHVFRGPTYGVYFPMPREFLFAPPCELTACC